MKFILLRLAVFLGTLAVCGVALGQSQPAATRPLSGMWVWGADTYKTREQQVKLLTFCRQHHFNHLDVHLQIEEAQGRESLANEKEFTELVTRAAQANVSVGALRGSQRMFFESNYERTLRELDAVLAFNRRLPAGSRLKEIKYDVEPQTLDEWRQGGAAREKIMREYLGCLKKLREALTCGSGSEKGLELSVDIPFWWDREDLKLEFEGHEKLFSQHVQDLTDSVTLMSYRRDPEMVKQLVENERAYAARTGKQVFAGLLHSKAKNPAEDFLSFYGRPTAEYERARQQLENWAASQPGMGGIMHHHYGSLVDSLKD